MLSFACASGFLRIRIFRQAATAGASTVPPKIFGWYYDLPKELTDTEDPKTASWRGGMAAKLTEFTLDEVHVAVDAASLVFAHSLLDDAASECCRLSSLADPSTWNSAILQRKVSLEQVSKCSLQELLAEVSANYVEQLTKESLMKRLDTVNGYCQLVSPFILDGVMFRYDRDRVNRLDKLRQQIIHRPCEKMSFSTTIEDDLAFLENTCHFLVFMISKRYGIRNDHKGVGHEEN